MTYLWKYMSLDKFEKLLENKGLYFSSGEQLQKSMDPIEGAIIDCFVEMTNFAMVEFQNRLKDSKSVEKYKNRENDPTGIINGFIAIYSKLADGYEKAVSVCKIIENLCFSFKDKTFICSMHQNNDENYALWKIYPTDLKGELQVNQGIAIKINEKYLKTNVGKLFKSLNGISKEKVKIIIKNVKYVFPDKLPTETISATHELIKLIGEKPKNYSLFLFKTKYYKFAKEKRMFIDFSKSAKDIDLGQGGYLQFNNIKEFFNPQNVSVYVSPFATESFKKYVIYLLEQKGLDGEKLVKQSSIKII